MTEPLTHAQTLLDAVRGLTESQPNATAVVLIDADGETPIRTREFFARAAHYAHALEAAGIRPGDLVALVLQHGQEVLFGFWGALLLGAVPSVFPFLTEKLDRTKYFDSVQTLVRHEQIRVIITYAELKPQLDALLADIPTLAAIIDKDALQPGGDSAAYLNRNPAQPEDTAFLQHSSGSTGLQKGVMLSHRAVLNQIRAYRQAIRLTPEDVVVSWLPLYHDMGLIAGFIMPMVAGVKLVIMSPFQWVRDPKILLQAIDRHRGTLCWLPNFAYNFMATRVRANDLDGLDLSSWRAAVNCSEPVYAESHRLFVEKFAPFGFRDSALTACYAMAENTFAVTQGGIDQPLTLDVVDRQAIMTDKLARPARAGTENQTFVSNGKPIPDCAVQIMDEARQALPERHVGEIALRSTFMLSGYFARPDLSESALVDGWYLTGDMGYLAEGELYITGRKKDLIIVGGKNVYPQDIENLLNDVAGLHPGRATAFGVLNAQLGTEDLAIIAEVAEGINAEDREQTAAIQREIRARIAQQTDVTARYVHLVPRQWLLKTSSGKIARSANHDKFMKEVLGETKNS